MPILRPILVLLTVVIACATGARADALDEIEALRAGGNTDAALQRAEAALASRPGDASLRFLHGVLLAESRQDVQAHQVFERLTQEFPELPEPYNNLAVLHARQGRWQQARLALEQALRSDPGYATARANLGDVYLQLALQSWEQAARELPGVALQDKIAAARSLAARPLTRTP